MGTCVQGNDGTATSAWQRRPAAAQVTAELELRECGTTAPVCTHKCRPGTLRNMVRVKNIYISARASPQLQASLSVLHT